LHSRPIKFMMESYVSQRRGQTKHPEQVRIITCLPSFFVHDRIQIIICCYPSTARNASTSLSLRGAFIPSIKTLEALLE
jgi:hypothetical protein